MRQNTIPYLGLFALAFDTALNAKLLKDDRLTRSNLTESPGKAGGLPVLFNPIQIGGGKI
ncbi:hypothetical protein SAMN04244579_03894 [Azotobacter beijerinckii]|uniref:Uncharacterized protein n=1 Tax=Azotobacter beijerinckii TaxID=170623 RepID=A0A1H6XUL1_9GAMM|nr:hypothetical protein SAMN04244579_03894 [Azotobacter beijerinckii]